MKELVAILIPIACGCVLPIMVVWLAIRKSMNETNQRTQIVLAAIEKNPDMDIEELMKKIDEYYQNDRMNSVRTEAELQVGQHIDFRG